MLANLFISLSSVVLISIQSFPDPIPSINPSAPSRTLSTAFGLGRHVIDISDFLASSFGVSNHLAPFLINSLPASLSRSFIKSSKPLSKTLFANLKPTFPNPIKPIFIIIYLSSL